MGELLAGASPAGVLVALLMAASGALLYAAPERPYRTIGQAGLALGWALATARYLGLGHGVAVALVGLAAAWLLDAGDDALPLALSERERESDVLGVPMRLLLALFAAIAAAAMLVGRPLGGSSALDANAAWYWSGALGLLVLMSERGTLAAARGGVLVLAAAALAALHLAPGPPLALVGACALLLLLVAGTVRGSAVPSEWAKERAGVLLDGLLAACALVLIVGLAAGGVAVGEAAFALGAEELPIAVAAAVLGVGIGLHARLAELPDGARIGWASLAATVLAVLALAAESPPVGGVLAAMVPVAVALVIGQSGGDSRAPSVLVAAVAGASAAAFGLVEAYQADGMQPVLARVGLALALLHAGLLGAIAPAHLWVLGLLGRAPAAEREPTARVVAATLVGLGALASMGLLAEAARRDEWLLALAGARPLAVGVAAVGMVAAGVALLGEERVDRLVVQLGALAGALAVLVLASVDAGAVPAASAALADRGAALVLALLGADALSRWGPGRRSTVGRRLLRLDAAPLWLGLAGLVGLPPTGGYWTRLEGLAAIAAERPDLAALGLAVAAVGLVAIKRAADAVVADAAAAEEPDERPSGWRRSVPLVLCGLYLARGLL